MENFIIGVAVKFKDITVCMPRPNRHRDCFLKAKEIGLTSESCRADDQGFYLADGTYLNRADALKHVEMVNQPLREPTSHYLFSENLW